MSNTPESNIPWWVIILGFILFWPAGLVLLLLNFSGVSLPLEELRQAFLPPSSPRQGQSPAREQGKAAQAKTVSYRYVYDPQQAKTAQPGVSRYTYAPRQGGATTQSSPLRVWKQPRLGKLMAASGGVLSFLSSLAFAEKFSFALQHGLLRYAVEWFAPFGFLCAGLFLLGKGIVQTRLARRMKLYQGVIGENISAAKLRIENMMDKVVEGFEKQLDQLFQSDAMDITADVDMLERMLDRDGLGASGMTLGL